MLHEIGRSDAPPVPPLNLLGDFGGGGMMLAFGVVCALLEARGSGKGQVIDAAMVEGSALLGAMIYGYKAFGAWRGERARACLPAARISTIPTHVRMANSCRSGRSNRGFTLCC